MYGELIYKHKIGSLPSERQSTGSRRLQGHHDGTKIQHFQTDLRIYRNVSHYTGNLFIHINCQIYIRQPRSIKVNQSIQYQVRITS